jgi:SagB-type dehydrogenase family enzyme
MERNRRAGRTRRQLLALGAGSMLLAANNVGQDMSDQKADIDPKAGRIALPAATFDRPLTVETAIKSRRSIREFRPGPLSIDEVAQILWSAQGITDAAGYRAAPSAGALYPLEVSLVAGDVRSLPAGIYRYVVRAHALDPTLSGDKRQTIARTALSQRWIADAPAILIIAAVEARTTAKYGRRGVRYTHIEAGHAAQNVYLQAGALGLGATIVGAFDDNAVAEAAGLHAEEAPLCILPVGRH